LLLVLRRRRDGVCFFLLGFPGCEITCGETKGPKLFFFFFFFFLVSSQRVSEGEGARFSFLLLFKSCIVVVIAVNGSRPIDRGILNKRKIKKKCGKGKRRNLEKPRCYESTREEFGRLYNSERDDSLQEL
jgi:hypothetical protein